VDAQRQFIATNNMKTSYGGKWWIKNCEPVCLSELKETLL